MNLFWEIHINYYVLFRISSSINKRIRLKYKALNCIYFIAWFNKSKHHINLFSDLKLWCVKAM